MTETKMPRRRNSRPDAPATGPKAPARRGRRLASATTINDIVAAARIEFAEHGFEAARVEHIARMAGVSKQLIYHYFADKNELYGIVLDEAARETNALLNSRDFEALPPADAISLFASRIMDDYLVRPAIGKMTMDEALHQGQHIRPKGYFTPLMRRIIDHTLAPILKRGAACGEFRADIDPDLFFWTIFSMTTAWFNHNAIMSMASGPRFAGDAGLALWRKNSIEYLLAVLRPA